MTALDLRAMMPNHAENVSLVRQLLGGVAGAVGVDQPVLDDVRTAVSEACNNVVIHAYEGSEGPLEVDVRVFDGELMVIVRDQGAGIQPRPVEPSAEVQGVGLSLITALSDRVEFLGGAGEGTEVRMTFATDVDRSLFPDGDLNSGQPIATSEPGADAAVSVCEGPLARPVLSSLVATLAARAGMSIENLADAQLVADAIAARAHDLSEGRHVHVAAHSGNGRLQLWVGGLRPDGASELIRSAVMPGLGDGSLFDHLASEVEVETDADGERLSLKLPA